MRLENTAGKPPCPRCTAELQTTAEATSALLTAGYLLPITVNGFLPGADYDYNALEKKEPCLTMLLPLMILAALAVLLGLFPNPLTAYICEIAAGVL